MSIVRLARRGASRARTREHPNWWYRLEGRRKRLGSREGLNRRSDAMDERHLVGSSETAGRNRHPRFTVS